MRKQFGRVIRELREEAGLSVLQLAHAAGIDPGALSRIETSERVGVRFSTVCSLAAALEISTDEIGRRSGLLKRRPGQLQIDPSGKAAQTLDEVRKLAALLDRATARVRKLRENLK